MKERQTLFAAGTIEAGRENGVGVLEEKGATVALNRGEDGGPIRGVQRIFGFEGIIEAGDAGEPNGNQVARATNPSKSW